MPLGLPVLISVTSLDKDFYGENADPARPEHRSGPDLDAVEVEEILFRRGATDVLPAVFLGTHARAQPPTRRNVIDALLRAGAQATRAGDTVFVYYAGHGTRFPAGYVGTDPRDALCLADGFLLDVELVAIWRTFPATARVVFIADCCHASDVTTGSWPVRIIRGIKRVLGMGDPTRSVHDKRALKILKDQPAVNERVQGWYRTALLAGGDNPASVQCALLVLAATSPDEILVVPDGRSPFALHLRSTLLFFPKLKSYDALMERVHASMGATVGNVNPGLAASGREDLPPQFTIAPFTLGTA